MGTTSSDRAEEGINASQASLDDVTNDEGARIVSRGDRNGERNVLQESASMPILGSFKATKTAPSSARSGTFLTGGAAARKAPKIVRIATRAKAPSLRDEGAVAETETLQASAPPSLRAELDSLEDIIANLETPSLGKSERSVLDDLANEIAPSRHEFAVSRIHDELEAEPNGAYVETKPGAMFPRSLEVDLPTTGAFPRLEHTVIIAHDRLGGRPHDIRDALDDSRKSLPNLGASGSQSDVLPTSTEQVVAQPAPSQWKSATLPMVLALIAIGLAVGGLVLRQGPSGRNAVVESTRGSDSPPSSPAAHVPSDPTAAVPPTREPVATTTASGDRPAIAATPHASRAMAAPTSAPRMDSVATNRETRASSSGKTGEASAAKVEEASHAKPRPPRSTRHLRGDRNDGKSNKSTAGNDVDDETQKALDALEKAQLERSFL